MQKTLGIVALALLSVGCSSGPVELTSSAARVQVSLDPFQLRIQSAGGATLLETSTLDQAGYGAPGVTTDLYEEIEQLVPGWDGYRAHEGNYLRATKAALLSSGKDSFKVSLQANGVEIWLSAKLEGARLRVEVEQQHPTGENKASLSFRLGSSERFFGLGERYASVDHRGLSIYSWSEEGGLGLGENAPVSPTNPAPNGPSMTYFPVPFFYSTAGWAMYLDTTYRTELHLGSERPDEWRLAVGATHFAFTVYLHDDPKESLNDYTADTGRAPIPAPWVFGPRRRVDNGNMVLGMEEWRALRVRGVPTTVLDDSVHFLPNRSEVGREAELKDWTTRMHAEGFKVTAYNNPYVSMTLPEAAADYAEGKAKGYFVLDPSGEPGVAVLISGTLENVASIDFTNPEAVTWYQGLLRRTLALGYDGWMHDFGEYVRRSWIFHDGRRGDELHNLYGVLSSQAAHALFEAERPNDYLYYVRSGYAGGQAYPPEVWGGDPEASFDETQGLPAMLRGGINLALSGVPYWGSDTSGFKCITDAPRDKEVYLRWAEASAVSTSMHDENACSNPLGHREKWTLWSDDETIAVYGNMARLHTRLLPYFQVLAQTAHETGLPPMRHPFLTHPSWSPGWVLEDAFFLGPSVFVAPVVRRGITARTLPLPPGRYLDLTDYRVYQGDPGGSPVTIPAPLGKLPLLLVEGQILPLLDPSIETLAPATDPTVVTLAKVSDRVDALAALGPGGQASLTLVDGTVLSASRVPQDTGTPAGWLEVGSSTIADCVRCFARTSTGASGDLVRVRVGTERGDSDVQIGDLHLTTRQSAGHRTRWDIILLR
ncbi:MAG: glycoside hydrolase family 31 protein [Myxococcota bacterium]